MALRESLETRVSEDGLGGMGVLGLVHEGCAKGIEIKLYYINEIFI